jgi:hypothetical protein
VAGDALNGSAGSTPAFPVVSSKLEANLVFNASHVLPRVVSADEIEESRLFKVSPNTGPFRELGVPLSRAVVPTALTPTNIFWQELGNRLAEVGVPRTKQQPYAMTSHSEQAVRTTFVISLLPPNVVRISARLVGMQVDANSFAAELIALQRIQNHPQVLKGLSVALGLVTTLDHLSYKEQRPARMSCAVGLAVQSPGVDVGLWVNAHEREISAVLVRDEDYETMDPSLIRSLFAKSSDLNVKSASELVLLDKQGLLYASQRVKDRFERLAQLQSLALAFEVFLSAYQASRAEAPEFFDFVLYKVAHWIRNPDPVFRRSVSTRYAWKLLTRESQLDSDLDQLLSGAGRQRIDDGKELFESVGDGWWARPNFGDILSESLAERRGDTRLKFVTDPGLRKIIMSDIREAEISLASGAYKSAVVIAGSVAEAMLLAAVLASPANTDSESQLMKDGLQDLCKKAKALNLVPDRGALALVDQWLRSYRNLVHPGVQRRTEAIPTKGKAEIAIHAINGLAEELAR